MSTTKPFRVSSFRVRQSHLFVLLSRAILIMANPKHSLQFEPTCWRFGNFSKHDL